MNNPEKLATSGAQDTTRRQTKQTQEHKAICTNKHK